MMEASVQLIPEEKQVDLVDFAIEWTRVLRKLKKSQEQGEIDTISYLFLVRDVEEMLHEVTQTLLFIV
jgi:hypothetical protein